MDCLEFGNLQEFVYADLAANISECREPSAAQTAFDVVTNKVDVRVREKKMKSDERIFLPVSRVNCHIGFAQIATNLPECHADSTIPILLNMLRDIPNTNFDHSLTWDDWALPDRLTFTVVSALLHIAIQNPRYREKVTQGILEFAAQTVVELKSEQDHLVLTQCAPAFHGFYRAIISTTFPWTINEWILLASHTAAIFEPETVDRLNTYLSNYLTVMDNHAEENVYVQNFIARYVSQDRPLTGYFLICCVIEILWTVLAQTLVPWTNPYASSIAIPSDEAAAANRVWLQLTNLAASPLEMTDSIREGLQNALGRAMNCFTDLMVQIESMDTEPSLDTYAWETMSESLKLACVCSAALQVLDEDLLGRLKLLLSEVSPVSDPLVQEAALKSTAVLVQNFNSIAASMSSHLRRFVTSPLPIFEYEFASEARAPPPLAAAAKTLALCIKLAPGEDFIMSNMYSLLNYIAATNQDVNGGSNVSLYANAPSLINNGDESIIYSVKSGLQGFTEEQRRLIGISTISVVARLAQEFKMEEVTKLTISMLLQRLRTAELAVESAIAYNLVDLAIIAPQSSFIDIIKAFSIINRSANPEDPRYSNNMVIAAQTRLAQEMNRRPEFYRIYLAELLGLFIDKGVSIQNAVIANPHLKIDDLVEQLGALLLPIDSILSHEDFNPHVTATLETILLFQNLWFICILFLLISPETNGQPSTEWQIAALTRISIKTPCIVREDFQDYVTSGIEYNTIIRQEYAHNKIAKHRELLCRYLPARAGDIHSFHPGRIIFLLTMHEVEKMRSSAGFPSSLAQYFLNDSINKQVALSACMSALAEKIIHGCISDMSRKVVQQNLPDVMTSELRSLLVYNCHRVAKVREVASIYLNQIISSFPSFMCDASLVYAILEVITILRKSCEGEFTDEYDPVFEFQSKFCGIILHLPDSYKIRNQMLSDLYHHAMAWFGLALARAPIEFQSILEKYLSSSNSFSIAHIELGASVALHFASALGPADRKTALISASIGHKPDRSREVTLRIADKERFSSGVSSQHGLEEEVKSGNVSSDSLVAFKKKLSTVLDTIKKKISIITNSELRTLLFRCASYLLITKDIYDLLHYLVVIPFEIFTPIAVATGVEVWTWIIRERPRLEIALMVKINTAWATSIRRQKGIYSNISDYNNPFYRPVEYTPTDKNIIDRNAAVVQKTLSPHALILQMLLSRFQAARYQKPSLMLLILRLILRSALEHKKLSTHPLARETRFSFLLFGFEVLKGTRIDSFCEQKLREALYAAAFSWFSVLSRFSFGANQLQVQADYKILLEFLSLLQTDAVRDSYVISSLSPLAPIKHPQGFKNFNQLLRLLVENELYRLSVWMNVMNDIKQNSDHPGSLEKTMFDDSWIRIVRIAWRIDPAIAVHLPSRFKSPIVEKEVGRWVRAHTRDVLDTPEAVRYLLADRTGFNVARDLKNILLWAPVTPVVAVTYFEPRYLSDPALLQYAHRVLAEHPVVVTFFFVPQIVQALRHDDLGYVERFIFETTRISQLFCHQIIWNMKANCYKDDAAEIEDSIKPKLDRVTAMILESLSGEARKFYDLEFSFFNDITSISGKLRPYIKKTKLEKKAKIDEEMAKIKAEVGVYLPSNPDGVVVDIDRKSGRPLQSHAKAPFMATFKVRKERLILKSEPDSVLGDEAGGKEYREEYDVWQAAIFKVGDDCRQDVLALQVIASFKNIFLNVGLNLYLFPYRVTATAPGCGVIDVVPNATSRDEMGRAKVNDLLGFFTSKYGPEDTIAFQRARLNFIHSMAAYSVACYILQIKDRHNGNIMVDGDGHIVHVDFGFLFDIDKFLSRRPGGIKFEPNSFKLNHEMVALMGGRHSQGYSLFQQLTVKAFLAIRPHAEEIISTVELMLGTQLPSFKGEGTIKRLRERFALTLNERQAAEWMISIIRNAHENMRSIAYDEFQRIQNGIPYK